MSDKFQVGDKADKVPMKKGERREYSHDGLVTRTYSKSAKSKAIHAKMGKSTDKSKHYNPNDVRTRARNLASDNRENEKRLKMDRF